MSCIFCEIAKKESPQQERVFREDDKFVAMLVSHPQTKGHFIVYPKQHASELVEMKEDLGGLFERSVLWGEEVVSALEAPAYVMKLNNKIYLLEDHPLHVGHIHMHVIPRYNKEERIDKEVEAASPEYFSELLGELSDFAS